MIISSTSQPSDYILYAMPKKSQKKCTSQILRDISFAIIYEKEPDKNLTDEKQISGVSA